MTEALPRFVKAIMFGVRSEIDRVFWNVHQRPWRRDGLCACPIEDARIEGLRWTQPAEWDDADCSGEFEFRGVTISWYKRLGRGMSASTSMSPTEWVDWYDAIFDICDLFEERHREIAEADANQPHSADRKCPRCGRWFSYPSRRCGYDAATLERGVRSAG